MAHPSILVDIPFSKGLDTKTDSYLVEPPFLTSLQNGVFTKSGTIVKRNGYSPLGTAVLGGGTVTNGKALATFDNELLQITATGELYSYSQSQNDWIDRGQVTPLTATETPIVRNTYTQSNPDMDTLNGVTVFAWEDTRGGIRATVIDEATGSAILTDVSLDANGANPNVVGVGTTICIVYAYTSGPSLAMVTLDTTSPTAFSARYTLDSNILASGNRIDAVRYDGSSFVVAWTSAASATRLGIVLPSGIMAGPVNGYPSPKALALDSSQSIDVLWDSAGGRFWVTGSSSTSGLVTTVQSSAFTQTLAPTTVDASTSIVGVTAAVSSNTLTVWYETTAAISYNHLVSKNTCTSSGTVGTPAVFLRSVGLGSEVFAQGSSSYLFVNFSSPLQSTTFLVDGSSGYVVAKGQPGLSGGLYTTSLPKVVSTATNEWSLPVPTRVQIDNQTTAVDGKVTSYTTFFLVGIDRLDLSFNSIDCFRSAQVGSNLHFTGGLLQIYDGQSVTEHGFHLFPEGVTAVASSSGGNMADGTYSACVVWYWQDARGQIHRSAPSAPVQFTISGGGGAGSCALTIPTLRITAKSGSRTAPVAAVFRTPANGTVFQRVGNGSADAVLAPVYSTTTADTVAFNLTTSDAQIAANEFLYTTGGVLPNQAPPPASLISASKNRLFLAGILGNPNQVYYSQPCFSGSPISFSPLLTMDVDPRGGPVTAMATVDSTTLTFKENSVFSFSGDGPDLTGGGNTFSDPQLVTTDVGCTNPEAIGVMPEGIVFKTAKGIYLLDRSLAATYIGAPVEAFNALTTSSAVLVDGVNQVRFTSSDGVGLVYDYYFGQWGTFTNFLAYDAVNWPRSPGTAATYAYLATNGNVMLETQGVYLDTYTPIPLYVQTAWIRVSNLQGFFKLPWVTVLGKFYSTHVLNVGVSYDYQEFVSGSWLFDPGMGAETYGTGTYGNETPYGGVSNTVYQFRFRPATSKMQSIRFAFTEQEPSSGQGFALSGMTLQIAQLPVPFKKLGAGQTVGAS